MDGGKRSYKNFLINPSFQIRVGFYFTALSLALIGLMMALMNAHLMDIKITVSNLPDIPVTAIQYIDESLSRLFKIAILFLGASLVGTIVYSIVISHRIAGPMYAILQYLDDLKTGNMDAKRTLRPYDELAPIMDSLQEFVEKVKNKK